MEKDIKKKIKSAFTLGVLGDILGYGNGEVEFNKGTVFSLETQGENYEQMGAEYSGSLVYEFIHSGGISENPKHDQTYSDDTLMLYANSNALIEWQESGSDKIDVLINIIQKHYIRLIDTRQKLEDYKEKYGGGLTTINYLKKLMNNQEYKNFVYDPKAGGSGATMRVMVFGMYFYKQEQILDLIKVVIESTHMTHPNVTAFLGAITLSLFCSYAMQNKKVNEWINDVLEFLDSDVLDNYLRENKESFMVYYKNDKQKYIEKWKDYLEDRFTEEFIYKPSMIMQYPFKRSLFYNKFSYRKNQIYPGAGSDDSVIISYDCLLDCFGSWEKLVYSSMLHVGDSDTTGIISGFIYGLYHGMSNVHPFMINNIGIVREEINLIFEKFKNL